MTKAVVKRAYKKPAKKVVRKPEVFEKLKQLVETGQTFGVTHQQLADKLNTRRQTVSDYLETIYAETPVEDIKHIQIKIQTMFDRLFREAQKMLITANDHKEKAEAMRLLLLMMDKFTDFLEKFGIKEKISDKIDLNASIEHKQIVVNYNMPNQIKND